MSLHHELHVEDALCELGCMSTPPSVWFKTKDCGDGEGGDMAPQHVKCGSMCPPTGSLGAVHLQRSTNHPRASLASGRPVFQSSRS